MKTFASALLLALFAAAAHASDPLGRALETRDWASGLTKCESLAADEARRPDQRQLSAAQYAEKAAQCAAIASGAGDQADATWWWFTAVAMDTQRSLELLPSLRQSGLLLELPPPRSLVGSNAGSLKPARSSSPTATWSKASWPSRRSGPNGRSTCSGRSRPSSRRRSSSKC